MLEASCGSNTQLVTCDQLFEIVRNTAASRIDVKKCFSIVSTVQYSSVCFRKYTIFLHRIDIQIRNRPWFTMVYYGLPMVHYGLPMVYLGQWSTSPEWSAAQLGSLLQCCGGPGSHDDDDLNKNSDKIIIIMLYHICKYIIIYMCVYYIILCIICWTFLNND